MTIEQDYLREEKHEIAMFQLHLSRLARGRAVSFYDACKEFDTRGLAEKFHDRYLRQHHIHSLSDDVLNE